MCCFVSLLVDRKPLKQHIFVGSNKLNNTFSLTATKEAIYFRWKLKKKRNKTFSLTVTKRSNNLSLAKKGVFASSYKTKGTLSLAVTERNNTFTQAIKKTTTDFRWQATISKHASSKATIREERQTIKRTDLFFVDSNKGYNTFSLSETKQPIFANKTTKKKTNKKNKQKNTLLLTETKQKPQFR